MATDAPLRSPLHDRHRTAGAKFADFAGWSMPLEYQGVVTEHTAVREAVGVFDVSHLGTLMVSGDLHALNRIVSNDLGRIGDGQAQYTLVLTVDGGVVDDLIVYRINSQEFILIPNAANCETVAAAVAQAGLTISDVTRTTAIIAVQGPLSDALVADLGVPELDYMSFCDATVAAAGVTVCRTGYTGERGVELLVSAESASRVWDAVINNGAQPCGLGARDTLRTEMGYPLHGHELSPDVPARWSSVGWAVAVDKGEFVGREAFVDTAAIRRILGLRLLERGVPRAGMDVTAHGSVVGQTTSGTFSPTLKAGIALARVEQDVTVGDRVEVQVRGRSLAAEVVRPPFVDSHVRG